MRTAMVFGTFDILHKGHLDFLRQAGKHADRLVVVVARDKTVLQLKNRLPLHGERERQEQLRKTGLAAKVLLGNLQDKYAIVRRVRPDVVCLGYDHDSFTTGLKAWLKKSGLGIKVVRMEPYIHHKYKSSKLRRLHYLKEHKHTKKAKREAD